MLVGSMSLKQSRRVDVMSIENAQIQTPAPEPDAKDDDRAVSRRHQSLPHSCSRIMTGVLHSDSGEQRKETGTLDVKWRKRRERETEREKMRGYKKEGRGGQRAIDFRYKAEI